MSMNQWLADIYGTPSAGDEQEKVAEAELFAKIAADNGIDLSQLAPEEIEALYSEVFKGAEGELSEEELAALEAERAAAEEEAAEEDEEAAEAEAKTAAAYRHWQEKRAYAEKVAEADEAGRVMAHAFIHEIEQVKAAAGTERMQGAAALAKRGVREFAAKHKVPMAVGGAAVAGGAGYGGYKALKALKGGKETSKEAMLIEGGVGAALANHRAQALEREHGLPAGTVRGTLGGAVRTGLGSAAGGLAGAALGGVPGALVGGIGGAVGGYHLNKGSQDRRLQQALAERDLANAVAAKADAVGSKEASFDPYVAGAIASTRDKVAGDAQFDEMAAWQAIEMAKNAGWDANEAYQRVDAVYTQGLEASPKIAMAGEFEDAVGYRALEFLEVAGYPIDWSQV